MFWYELKFLFPKNTNYWPKPKLNQNYEREREDFVMRNLKINNNNNNNNNNNKTTPKHIKKIKKKKTYQPKLEL